MGTFTKRLLTIKEAAEYLGVSQKTLYKWVSQRKIPCVKLSRKLLRFDVGCLDKIIEEKTQQPLDLDSFSPVTYNMMPIKPHKKEAKNGNL
ncbi:MAG: helix-turn-helix domain-containing protein [Candidatus Omnitrophica bacterium]|nr:helix-turn-helix domain-containing protein [Candidatus Omnitrophota bacterium]